MKQLTSLLITFLSIAGLMAQGNLVPNPSFEMKTSCPASNGQFYLVADWNNPTNGSPDYFDSCFTFSPAGYGVPNNILGEQYAHSGWAYPGLVVYFGTYMEYIQTQLTEPLQPGETYCISFYVSLAGKSDFASCGPQLYLSPTAISSSTSLRFPYTPQIIDTTIIYDTTSWTLITGEYTAQGGENYLTIGNFLTEAETPHDSINNTTTGASYFYIDDVVIYQKVEAHAGSNFEICKNDSAQLGINYQYSGINYYWTPTTALSDSTSHHPWVKPLTTTTYFLSISDTAGLYCPGRMIDSMTVTVNDCTPLPQFSIPTMLKGDELFFVTALPENSALELYDTRGRLVFKSDNYRNDYSADNLAIGIYVYRLSFADGNHQTGKICVVK